MAHFEIVPLAEPHTVAEAEPLGAEAEEEREGLVEALGLALPLREREGVPLLLGHCEGVAHADAEGVSEA